LTTFRLAVNQVNSIVNEIAYASAEQATGVHEAAQAITHMDATTQQNVRLVELTSAAALTLDGQSRELREAVGVFSLA